MSRNWKDAVLQLKAIVSDATAIVKDAQDLAADETVKDKLHDAYSKMLDAESHAIQLIKDLEG